MENRGFLIGVFVCLFVAEAMLERPKASMAASNIWKRIFRRTFECRQNLESCRGVPWARCCGDMVCFRESEVEIHDPFDEGYCVECVDRGQICQRDEQCCEPLTCLREGKFHINGLCDIKLENGERCTEDDDCASDRCNRKHFFSLTGTCD